MGDLMDWGLSMTRGKAAWHASDPLPWEEEKARFFAALTAWDEYLASGAPIAIGRTTADQDAPNPKYEFD
jgi:hypothetical protein